MPEIKHNFTGGKMNKDVDQRLVPKGEYRDAMNIQVSTSEGSDVGTVQNILGNSAVVSDLGIHANSTCVGAVADEKNDALYWFVREPLSQYNTTIAQSRDIIFELKNGNVKHVFVDKKQISIGVAGLSYPASGDINVSSQIGFNAINVGDTFQLWQLGVNISGNEFYTVLSKDAATLKINIGDYTNASWANTQAQGSGELQVVPLGSGGVLKFPESTINSINIIDDMLFWTDGHYDVYGELVGSEPKKINITRSIEGTDSGGQTHTRIVNPELPTLNELVRPHHIQVLKRKPTKSLNVNLQDNRRLGVVYSTTTFKFSNPSTSNLYSIGFTSTITVDSGSPGTIVNYQVGDTLLLLNTLDLLAVNNETLPHQYDVRLIVESINHNVGAGTSQINFEILSISTDTPVQLEDYTVLLSESGSDDFKNSMFRFSYRYKFLDGETSAFAPFTPVAFIPGEFKYNKTNAYNEGMVNNVSEVVLNDFIDLPNTLDVSSIDLLVKYENSPNVYIIDTVKRGKFNQTIPHTNGNPFGGTYTFNPKQIKATLPQNQLLRAWDSVPKRALTQEVTGNRLVYGNYVHSHDYKSEDLHILPSVKKRNVELIRETDGAPSVKTQRSYQIGVVFVDSEGRESPIITNETSSITVSKPIVNTNTMLGVVNNSSIPSWVNSYKYYVKDHKQPFYNIVLDSFYKAKNGDFWISVPSSERNKVQEGDLLELKKGINSNAAVLEKSETKVIAIENEAPDFIKTSYRSLGKAKQEDVVGGNTNKLIEAGGLAAVGKDWFWVDENNWLTQNSEGFGGGGKLTGFDEMAIRFEAAPALNTAIGGVYKSKLYECSTITSGTGVGGSNNVFIVRLKERISEADSWIIDPDDANGEDIEPTLKLEVFERVIAPSADYHGKFFAKIEAKEDLLQNMAVLDINDSWQQQQHIQMIHNFCDEGADRNTDTSISGVALTESDYDLSSYAQYLPSNGGLDGNGNQIATTGETDNYLHWENIFEYFNVGPYNVLPQYWFVDRMYYRGLQDPNSSTPDMYQDGSNMGRGIFQATAADVALNLYGGSFVQQGGYYMEVSLVGMFPTINHNNVGNVNSVDFGWDSRWTATSGPFFSDPPGEVLSGHQPTFNAITQADALHHLTLAGQRWKWEDSDVVFTITNTHTNFRYNYAGGDEALAEYYDEVAASQATPPTQYWDYARHQFSHPLNRRLTIILELDKDPRIWGVDITDSVTYGTQVGSDAVGANMVFLETGFEAVEGEALTTNNPAVFEVKKTDEDNLDVYHEASSEIPIDLSYANLSRLIPVGSKVTYPGDDTLLNNSVVTSITSGFPSKIIINNAASGANIIWQDIVDNGDKLSFVTPSGDSINIALQIVQDGSTTSPLLTPVDSTLGEGFSMGLNWFNCISFRNGVESFYLKDDFNEKFITKGVKVSSTLDKNYEETHRQSGLIYSGLFNSTSELNNLNQFIAAEKITKDINPIYGSIQKLYSGWGQGGDLIALCEDRILKILANKDALFNADGNSNVTSTNNVLGQAIPYSGEYGISKNPESFASEAYRIYFTDKVRGTVMRLSMDGLTPISNHGMKDWFRDKLKLGDKLIGSYDDKKDEYNVTIKGNTIAKTVTFREDVKGWVSFKSFIPENAISCANEYYTFKDGNIWRHHDELVNRNTFYNTSLLFPENFFEPSSVEVIFNEVPGSVKSFKTVSYEGSQAKVTSRDENNVIFNDGEYFNLEDVPGWHVTNVVTNLEQGGITEFINKEGKWFGYVTGNDVTINPNGNVSGNYDTEDSSIQGVGRVASVVTSVIYGCMDATMFNYNSAATIDDGSCVAIVNGCIDASASNFNGGANTDDGTCYWLGCTQGPLAVWSDQFAGDANFNASGVAGSINFDSNATVDDGSCTPAIYGCTISGNFNFNPSANLAGSLLSDGTPCGSANCMCIPLIYGCTDPDADNPPTFVDEMTDINTEDGSCTYSGCTDPIATNYSLIFAGSTVDGPNGNLTYLNGNAVDDGSCTYIGGCMDPIACNYDSTATQDNGSCSYCADNNAVNYDAAAVDYTCVGACAYCNDVASVTITSQTTADAGMSNGEVTIEWPVSTSSSATSYQVIASGITAVTIMPSGNATETHTITGLGTGTHTIYVVTFCESNTGAVLLAGLQLPGGNMGTGPNFGTPVTATITSTPIPGCTDNTGVNNNVGGTWGACNYNATATVDDGSCEYTTCTGCSDNTFLEFCDDCWDTINQVVVVSGGSAWVADTIPTSCTTLIVPGCMDATAINFDAAATVDDGSCIMPIYGCMDSTLNNDGTYAASNYAGPSNTLGANGTEQTPVANTDDGSCNPYNCPIGPNINLGSLTGSIAISFDVANTIYSNQSGFGGPPYDFTVSLDVVGDSGNSISSNASVSGFNSSCTTCPLIKTVSVNAVSNWIQGQTSITVTSTVDSNDGFCSLSETATFTVGCMDTAAFSYNSSLDLHDDSQCVYAGCTDSSACNVTPGATIDDGSCTYPGCTDANASNYDAAAGCDDGSCGIEGCTDSTLNADGNGNYAADNYDPTATIPCNDGTGDNSCCTYSGIPFVYGLYGWPSGGSSARYHIKAFGENTDTAYDQAIVTSVDVGVGSNTSTITNPGIEILATASWSNGNHLFSSFVGQFNWAPYVDINGAYGVGSGDLTITYNTDWSGTIVNPSMNNEITTSTINTYVLTAGCRNDGSAMNHNSNLDLHIDGSCIAPNPGCMDSTATNYGAAFNQDCTQTSSANSNTQPNDCCCYTCDVPTWDATNPVVVNTWAGVAPNLYASQITFNFAAVSTAVDYSLFLKQGSAYVFLSNITPTSIVNGIASYIYNNTTPSWFQDESAMEFMAEAHCENADGDSCGAAATPWLPITLNSNP